MRARRILYVYSPFVLLCVIVASRWLVEGAIPATSSTFLSQGFGCAMAAGLAGSLEGLRRLWGVPRRVEGGWTWGAPMGACLVLGGPVMAAALSGRHLGADTATLGLAMVPVVAGVAGSASGSAETGDLPGLLWPGLAGIAGLLLLLPQPSFSGWRPWAGLLSLPLMVGLGGWLAMVAGAPEREHGSEMQGFGMTGGLLLAAGVFGGFWLGSRQGASWHVSWGACGLDGLTAVLTLTALGRMGVQQWSAQFLWVPLLGLLEGMVFLRPVLDLRSWLGLGLIAVGGVYQMLPRDGVRAELPSLRGREDVPGA